MDLFPPDQPRGHDSNVPDHMHGRVLRPEQFLASAEYDSATPAPPLRPWVERYWSVRWSLAAGESFTAMTISEPTVNLTVERGGIRRNGACGEGFWLTGPVSTGRFSATLTGEGQVLGVKFRLGGPLAFPAGRLLDLVSLTDRTVAAVGYFGEVPVAAGRASEAAPSLDAWLVGLRPQEPAGLEGFRHLLGLLEDPAVTSVDRLCDVSGFSARGVQRQFHRFVGVGAKRMLVRARVLDAVAAIDSGDVRDLADLCADLGWYDQAHFTRDFRSVTGTTPAAYRAADRGRRPARG